MPRSVTGTSGSNRIRSRLGLEELAASLGEPALRLLDRTEVHEGLAELRARDLSDRLADVEEVLGIATDDLREHVHRAGAQDEVDHLREGGDALGDVRAAGAFDADRDVRHQTE